MMCSYCRKLKKEKKSIREQGIVDIVENQDMTEFIF